MSKLVHGNISPLTECPYKVDCECREVCHHTGKEHSIAFSCAIARMFEMFHKKEKKR